MTKSTEGRIKAFVSDFIRSEDVQEYSASRSSDFMHDAERSERCYDAAEYGAEGSTHYEIIGDWRAAFRDFIANRRRLALSDLETFEDAVLAEFNAVEEWHEANGSLHTEVG